MLGELGAVEEQGAVLGEDALEAEQQREVLPPGRGGLLEALVELAQGSVEGEPAGDARNQVRERFALEQDRFPRELLNTFEVGAGRRGGRGCGKCGGFCHEKGFVGHAVRSRTG